MAHLMLQVRQQLTAEIVGYLTSTGNYNSNAGAMGIIETVDSSGDFDAIKGEVAKMHEMTDEAHRTQPTPPTQVQGVV